MNTEMLPPPVAPIAPKPKRKIGVGSWIGIGVAVLVIMGMIGNALDKGDDTTSSYHAPVEAQDAYAEFAGTDAELSILDIAWSENRVEVCDLLNNASSSEARTILADTFVIGVQGQFEMSAAGEQHLRSLMAEC